MDFNKMSFGQKGNRAQDYYDITDKVVSIESLRETIKVNDPKPFVLHI